MSEDACEVRIFGARASDFLARCLQTLIPEDYIWHRQQDFQLRPKSKATLTRGSPNPPN